MRLSLYILAFTVAVCAGAAEPMLLARLEPESAEAAQPQPEKLIVPREAQEPVLLAAHHAYTVWSQQFMGAMLTDDQTSAWKEFLGMDIRMGDAYRQMGAAAYGEGKLEEAAKLLSIAVDFLEPDAELLSQLGFALKSTGQYERALEVLTQASQIDGARPEIWLWLGDTQRLLGDYEAAHKSFTTCKDIAPEDTAQTLDDYIKYTERLKAAEPTWDNFETHMDFAPRHESQGRVLRLIKEYSAALAVAPEPEEGQNERIFRVGWVQMQIGAQWAFYKQPALAMDYYQQSLETYRKTGSNTDLMRIHQNMALAYEQLAERYPRERALNLELAAQQWQGAHDLAKQSGDAEYLRHAMGGLLASLVQLRPIDDPRILELRTALQKEIPFRPPVSDYTIASAIRGEAEARIKEGDFGGARTLLEMADGYYKETGFLVDLEYRAMSLAQLASVYLAQDHLDKVADLAQQSLQQVNDLKQYLDADGFGRSMNPQTRRRTAAVQALAAVKQEKPEDAYAALEQYQALAAQELMGSRTQPEAWRTDFAAEEDLLLEREGFLKARLEEAAAARDTAKADWYQARLDYVTNRVRRLPLAQQLTPGNKLSYRGVEVLPLADAQAALPEAVTVLYLATAETGAVAVMLTKDSVKGVALGQGTDLDVETTIDAFHAALDAGNTDDARTHMAKLNDTYLTPLKGVLPETGTLVIAGDHLLYGLPWRAIDTAGIIPAGLRLCNAPGAGTYIRMADARRGLTATALDAATGDIPAALQTQTPGGALLVSAVLDRQTEDPTMGLWTAPGADPATEGFLTARLLDYDMPHTLLALDLELTPGAPPAPQLHFLALAEIAWRAGSAAIITNTWPIDAAIRKEFYDALTAALPTQSPLEAFHTAQEAVKQSHSDGLEWAAFQYLGAE